MKRDSIMAKPEITVKYAENPKSNVCETIFQTRMSEMRIHLPEV